MLLTRGSKQDIMITSPIMPAAGVAGFGDSYRQLVDWTRMGAFVTNPVTYRAWRPARNTVRAAR